MTFKKKYAVSLGLALLLAVAFMLYLPGLGVLILSSALIAYVLDPIVDSMVEHRMPRTVTAFALAFGIAFLLLGLILPSLPTIIEELIKLARSFPAMYDAKIAPFIVAETGFDMNWSWILAHVPKDSMKLADFGAGVGTLAGLVINGLFFLMLIFIFLRDWDRIVCATRQLLHDLTPDDWNDEIDIVFMQIGRTLSRLIRGQAEVSTILAIYYFVMFQTIAVIAKGDFVGAWGFVQAFFTPSVWMVIGIITGYLNMLPYIGVPVGGVIAAILGLVSFQFNAIWIYPAIFIIVTLGITIDHKALTPKVIGRSVSVHELWVYVAVYLGFALGGIVGVILALPAMAVISEVVKHTLALWRRHRHDEREAERMVKSSSIQVSGRQ